MSHQTARYHNPPEHDTLAAVQSSRIFHGRLNESGHDFFIFGGKMES